MGSTTKMTPVRHRHFFSCGQVRPWSGRTIATCVAVLLLLYVGMGNLAAAWQSSPGDRFTIEGTTMGPIPYRVIVANPPATLTQDDAGSAVRNALERINQLMSTYQSNSDVSRFNRLESTDWLEIDPETALVVANAIELSEATDGAFDITVGPAVNRWRFGPDKSLDDFAVPTAAEIEALQKIVGYRLLEVRTSPPAIRKLNPQTSIDLSAIAKGYAVDAVGTALRELDCQNYLIEVGGEVLLKGERAEGELWRIGIEVPDELQTQRATEFLTISDCAIATSGDYRSYRVIDKKRYSHIIDPRTCLPVENWVASATIIADDCLSADAIATAVLVLGAQAGIAVCERIGMQGLIKVRDEEFGDQFNEYRTQAFPDTTSLAQTNDAGAGGVGADQAHGAQSIWPAFLAALVVFLLAVLGMASGAIFGNRTLRGSCGGVATATNAAGESVCGTCSQPVDQCPEEPVAPGAET